MIRLVQIVLLVLIGYFVIRYLIRKFVRAVHQPEQGSRPRQSGTSTCTEEEYRQILGIADNDGPETIRRKYKELLARYHPDKVQHLGVEFQEIAEKKTRAIVKAYEYFRKKHTP